MQLSSKASTIVQNIFCLYCVTSFTQLWHAIPVATKCTLSILLFLINKARDRQKLLQSRQPQPRPAPVQAVPPAHVHLDHARAVDIQQAVGRLHVGRPAHGTGALAAALEGKLRGRAAAHALASWLCS